MSNVIPFPYGGRASRPIKRDKIDPHTRKGIEAYRATGEALIPFCDRVSNTGDYPITPDKVQEILFNTEFAVEPVTSRNDPPYGRFTIGSRITTGRHRISFSPNVVEQYRPGRASEIVGNYAVALAVGATLAGDQPHLDSRVWRGVAIFNVSVMLAHRYAAYETMRQFAEVGVPADALSMMPVHPHLPAQLNPLTHEEFLTLRLPR